MQKSGLNLLDELLQIPSGDTLVTRSLREAFRATTYGEMTRRILNERLKGNLSEYNAFIFHAALALAFGLGDEAIDWLGMAAYVGEEPAQQSLAYKFLRILGNSSDSPSM